jgi:hypothetical protein
MGVLLGLGGLQVLAAHVVSAEVKAKAAQDKNSDDGSDSDSDILEVSYRPRKGVVWKETVFGLLQAVTINTMLLLPCWVIVAHKVSSSSSPPRTLHEEFRYEHLFGVHSRAFLMLTLTSPLFVCRLPLWQDYSSPPRL